MAIPLLGGLIGKGLDLVAGGVARFQARKLVKIEGAIEVERRKHDYKMAKLDRKIGVIKQREQNDADYDMQVLRNRQTTWADEILIVITLVIWVSHYIPYMQPYMAGGWTAMGYNGVPWWFEFVLVGIFVSTLGLMRLLRLFITKGKDAKS